MTDRSLCRKSRALRLSCDLRRWSLDPCLRNVASRFRSWRIEINTTIRIKIRIGVLSVPDFTLQLLLATGKNDEHPRLKSRRKKGSRALASLSRRRCSASVPRRPRCRTPGLRLHRTLTSGLGDEALLMLSGSGRGMSLALIWAWRAWGWVRLEGDG